jgi:D-galactarolactone cycloisomerase
VKITDIRLERLRLPLDPPFRAAWDPVPRTSFDATLVRVHTDEGVTGVGSGDTMAGFAGHEGLFLGEDPRDMQRHVRALESLSFHQGRSWPLEAALWDVVGQVTGQPVAALMGNATQRIPAYASTGEAKSATERVESAHALRAQGFRAMKIRLLPGRLDEGVETVRAVREALGDAMTVMVDLNQSWRMAGDVARATDRPETRRVVAQLQELGVFWVEEPLPYADLDGLAELRAQTGARLAGGEMLDDVPAVLAHLDRDALDVYQMDVVLALGMSRARTLGELALLKHRHFTPHTWSNGIGVLANLHVAAGIGGGPWIEVPYDPPGWTPERRDFMLAEPVRIDAEGCLVVPDRPGLGVVLDEDAIAATRKDA